MPALILPLIALAIDVPKFVKVFFIELHSPLKNDVKLENTPFTAFQARCV